MARSPSTAARRLVPPAEAAAYYGTSTRTIRRRISDGTLTGFRLPGSRLIRVDLDELEAKLRPIPTVGGAAPTEQVSA